jgi:DNA-binding GntR family transcriptional regulator
MNNDKTILSVTVTLVLLGSIFFVIEQVLARGRNRAQSGLPAALPTKSESRHLQTSPSTPALEVLSVGFLDSNVPARGKRR